MNLSEAIVTLAEKSKGNTFAESLVQQFRNRGSLSPKQEFWAIKLANEANEAKPENRESATLDFEPIRSLFQYAGSRLKWPKISLSDATGRPVVLSLSGPRSKYPGTVNVTDGGRYGENTWYGRIGTDGVFQGSRNADIVITDTLKAFSADPAGMASAYGKRTGNCCFCRKGLTDDRSVSVGYGPVCAGHYRLPWGT
jgi:hypothetical protein